MSFNGRLYKFKEANEQSISALEQNQLWISSVYKMNDPMDLGFYIDKTKILFNYLDDEIIEFQKNITSHLFCASFTTIYANKRLWNYYSGGFTGIVIGYKSSIIKNALKRIGLYGNDNKVIYKDTKSFDYTNLFNNYIQGKRWETLLEWKSLFTKDISWEEEREYRFSLNTPNDQKIIQAGGFLLDGVKPSVVLVGYKIDNALFERLRKHCIKNSISLKKYMPKFDTNDIDYKIVDVI